MPLALGQALSTSSPLLPRAPTPEMSISLLTPSEPRPDLLLSTLLGQVYANVLALDPLFPPSWQQAGTLEFRGQLKSAAQSPKDSSTSLPLGTAPHFPPTSSEQRQPLHTYAEVSILVVARAALGPPPVHGPEATPIRRLIADPKAQGRKPLENIENQSLLLE